MGKLLERRPIDEFTRLRFLAAYPEQSTYSSADFLRRLTAWYARRGIKVECVQTDNGSEFTNRFSSSKRELPTLFERTAALPQTVPEFDHTQGWRISRMSFSSASVCWFGWLWGRLDWQARDATLPSQRCFQK